MSGELVQRLYDDHSELLSFLTECGEISYASIIESSFPKVVLLAAASDLEARMTSILLNFFNMKTSSEFAVSFVRNKAIERQYHTFFDWPGRSANKFFALFGDGFKSKAKRVIQSDGHLASGVAAFCEIGDLRNQLVHQDYAAFTVEKTAEEVYALYESALVFVERLPALLDES